MTANRIPAGMIPTGKIIIVCLLLFNLVICVQAAEVLRVANFSNSELIDWKPKIFHGQTEYRLARNDRKTMVLCGESRAAASGMIREITIDLKKTPYLNWSWWIDSAFQHDNEKTKSGDDFPARVYVIVDGGLLFWNTKALNYVWASKAAQDSHWTSPFISEQVKIIAVESGTLRQGTWQNEKRNVLQDLETVFAKPITQIDAVAVMTDTDNTGMQAKACYGDIYFSAD